MRITDQQQQLLAQLRCERLSADDRNLRAVEDFSNAKNENLTEVLQGSAFTEDANNTTAYYLIKDADDDLLFYFSLRCGALYDEFVEYERLESLRTLCSQLVDLRRSGDLTEEELHQVDSILERLRGRKGSRKPT